MGIDSFTLFAQLVNFCVLVWILKHFLYQPVLNIISQRSQEIEALNQSSLLMQKETEAKRHQLEKERKEFDKNCQFQIEELTKELTLKRKKELEKLKSEITQKRTKGIAALVNEKNTFKNETVRFITKDFSKTIEKILTNFTKTAPMDQMLDLFIEKFNSLKKSEKEKINNLIKLQRLICVNSSNTLTQKQQEKIIFLLKKCFIFPPKSKIVFKTSPTLIQGIELRVGSFSVQWSIQNYMDEFQENLDKHLKQVF